MNEISTSKLMADTKFYSDYARFNEETGTFESWDEAVDRVMAMHRTKYADKMTPELDNVLHKIAGVYRRKGMLGAQRALQFGGPQLLRKHAKMYNCVSSYVDRPEFFGEYMWLMLCGCGAGFSVQKHHIAKLPEIRQRKKSVKRFVVPDTIEGWAEAFDVLFSSFFVGGGKHPEFEGHPVWFDLSQIRPRGAMISGGFKAPGPEPLQHALTKVELLLTKADKRLRPIEVYDACMYMADAVISGGVRRSATICLFSKDDEEMIKAKTGSWFIDNPQRGRSNNSVMLLRDEVTFEEFQEIMKSVEHSGEPGFIFTDSLEFTFNPCVEIGKKPVTESGISGWQGCNLSEINGGYCTTPELFYEACWAAAAIGTLQAGYTEFEFLTEASKEIFEREALIGVSITGWMNNPHVLFDEEVLRKGAQIVKQVNKYVAGLIGTRPAARTTCAKPSGNASVILGTASGIHGEHAKRYIRHVQMNNESEVLHAIREMFPAMVESSVWSTNGTDSVVAFPIISKEGSIYKGDLLGVRQLEYVKKAQQVWVEEGTNVDLCVDPRLRHNISNTISVDNWEEVTKYLYENRQWFCGVSLMAASGDKAFPQAPFTEVLTAEEIIAKYGPAAMLASGVVTRALDCFGDLWKATSTAMGYGENLSVATHENAAKRDWVRQFKKFAANYFPTEADQKWQLIEVPIGDENKTADLLKDVYNLHKWVKIMQAKPDIDLRGHLKQKQFVDVGTLSGAACAGGQCDITF
jgi:ribonucleoside-triphosphate reductase (thioredoxin)